MEKSIYLILLLVVVVLMQHCQSGGETSDAEGMEAAKSSEVEDTPYPERAFWGDTHVHTGWSADAGMDGAITTPEDAYRFALGQEVTSNSGLKAKLARPFDWFLVSDHSDGMGTINEIVAGQISSRDGMNP